MSAVDHGDEPLDRSHLLARREMNSQYQFRPCGGRVGGSAKPPVPTDQSFEQNLTPASGDFVVGVIDTGLVMQDGGPHPWLAGHVEYGEDVQDPLPVSPAILDPAHEYAHGTFISGLILRQAPSVTIRMIRAIANPENLTMTDASVATAIDALASDTRVKVINLSFSGRSWETLPPKGIQKALRGLRPDVVVVAAASNNKGSTKAWPAAMAHVIAVGAVDETAAVNPGVLPPIAEFSDHGDWVDAYASGVCVLGPFLNFHNTTPLQTFAGWALWYGTSFATAIVAGQIARRAIESGDDATEAARRLLDEGPRLVGKEYAETRHPTYVRSVDSPVGVPFRDCHSGADESLS